MLWVNVSHKEKLNVSNLLLVKNTFTNNSHLKIGIEELCDKLQVFWEVILGCNFKHASKWVSTMECNMTSFRVDMFGTALTDTHIHKRHVMFSRYMFNLFIRLQTALYEPNPIQLSDEATMQFQDKGRNVPLSWQGLCECPYLDKAHSKLVPG